MVALRWFLVVVLVIKSHSDRFAETREKWEVVGLSTCKVDDPSCHLPTFTGISRVLRHSIAML